MEKLIFFKKDRKDRKDIKSSNPKNIKSITKKESEKKKKHYEIKNKKEINRISPLHDKNGKIYRSGRE